jgi:hypothetical protein
MCLPQGVSWWEYLGGRVKKEVTHLGLTVWEAERKETQPGEWAWGHVFLWGNSVSPGQSMLLCDDFPWVPSGQGTADFSGLCEHHGAGNPRKLLISKMNGCVSYFHKHPLSQEKLTKCEPTFYRGKVLGKNVGVSYMTRNKRPQTELACAASAWKSTMSPAFQKPPPHPSSHSLSITLF